MITRIEIVASRDAPDEPAEALGALLPYKRPLVPVLEIIVHGYCWKILTTQVLQMSDPDSS